MTRKKLILMVATLALAALVVTPVLAGIQGGGVSGVQVQNLSTSSNTITVKLYPQSGGSAITLDPVTVQPESATNFYLPSLNNVTDGSYSTVVSAQQPVAAIARTDWSATGGAGIYSSAAPGKSVLISLAVQNFAGQTSQFTIQNADSTDASDIKIEVVARGTGNVVKTLSNQSIAAGASKTYDLGDTATFGTLPNTGTDLGVSSGFVGLIKITSTKDLVAQSFIDIAGTPGVTAFSGIASTSADTTLYCPLVRANYYGDTGIQIVNTNTSDANVTITFYADPSSPNKAGSPYTQNMTIAANSSDIAFQGPGGNSRSAPTNLPGGSQTASNTALTNDGFFGSAKITSDKPVVAVVNDTEFGANYSVKGQSTYNCVPSSGVGKKHFLPLVRKFHLADTKLTTGVQVMNVTNQSNTVTLNLANWDGTDATDPAAQTASANGAVNFFGGSWTGLPTVPPELGGSGWFGSGVITCTQDCVVIVSDEGFGTKAVDRANYIGITQ